MGLLNKILGVLVGISGFVILLLKGRLTAEKAERREEELERTKAAQRASDAATEALIKGMERENETITGRTHDFRD